MTTARWKVISNYDPTKQYPVRITAKMARTLKKFKIGDIFVPREFAIKHQNDKNWMSVMTVENIVNSVYMATKLAQEMGLVVKLLPKNQKTSFDEFINITEINDWLQEITPMSLKHTKQTKYLGYRGRCAHTAWKLNDWLIDRDFEFDQEFEVSKNIYKRETKLIKLHGLVNLLKLLQDTHGDKMRFNQIVKKYLRDPIHDRKGASAMRNTVNVIKAFFVFYDVALTFTFNHRAGHRVLDGDEEQKQMSLNDFFNLMTVGKPSIVEKAVFMCKLHRGLDNITFTDRFNYQAFEQLAKYFGHDDHNAWNLDLCPAPIELVRVKTRFKHVGFLERDAITALQDALDVRKEKTGLSMKKGDAIFLNKYGSPIGEGWIYDHFTDIANRAKLRRLRDGYDNSYNMDAHESRDLLKSIGKQCKVDSDARDHFIGHKPKDSYEKESILFPELLRKEYAKMSSKLNIFTKFTSIINGIDDSDELKIQLNEKLSELDRIKDSRLSDNARQIRNEKFALEQQRQMKLLQDTVNELKKEIRTVRQTERKIIEFCCINCSTVHDSQVCPACGSKLKRIFEESVQS